MKKKIVEGAKCKCCIVKRKGHTEKFDERKVYASCYAACLSSHVPHVEAEKICGKVANEIRAWARKKKAVSSDEIFAKVTAAIKKHNEDAAFMYESHSDIS